MASNLAEDGDNASLSDNLDDGFACLYNGEPVVKLVNGFCEPVCCGDDVLEDSRDLDELLEMRREIADMKRMIKPSSVSIEDGAPPPPLMRSHSRSPRQGPPSPRMQSSLQIDMKRQESRHGKLMKLSENDLVEVDTGDEEERQRREAYYTSLGRQGYAQEEHDNSWDNFLQCSNLCISWNNCEKGEDDNMSDITEPTELPWNDDYHRNVIMTPTMRTSPTMKTETSLALSGYSRNIRSRPSYHGMSVAPSRKTMTSKTPSNGTPSSNNSKKMGRLPKSPLRSNKPDNKVKARKVMDEDTGTVLFEV